MKSFDRLSILSVRVLILSLVSKLRSFSFVSNGIVFLVSVIKFNSSPLFFSLTSSEFSISKTILSKFSFSVSMTEVLFN